MAITEVWRDKYSRQTFIEQRIGEARFIGTLFGETVIEKHPDGTFEINGEKYRDGQMRVDGVMVDFGSLFADTDPQIRDLSAIPIIPPGLGKALWWVGFIFLGLWSLSGFLNI